jgi:hypothetical protein
MIATFLLGGFIYSLVGPTCISLNKRVSTCSKKLCAKMNVASIDYHEI